MNNIVTKYTCKDLPDDVIGIILRYIGYIKFNGSLIRPIKPKFIVYNSDGNGFSVNNNLVCINGNYYYVRL